MKKLVLMIAAVAAMTFVSCDQKKNDNAANGEVAADSAAVEAVADSTAADSTVVDEAAAAVEEAPVVEKEEEEPAVPVKKTRSKRVSVDDFPPEVLERIFEEYSQRPAAEFAKELDIPEKYLHKAIARMKELFEMSISTGDLSQEDYEEIVAPKLQEYQEPKDGFEVFVQKKLKKLKK